MTTRYADHVPTGTLAARPAASAVPVGTLYSCTTDGTIYQSSGSAWGTWLGPAAAGPTGPTGPVGATGPTGATGATGAGGSSGPWTLISTTTLVANGTFDISSISGSYSDLHLVVIGRGAASGGSDNLSLRFNNDTGANYYNQRLSGIGSTAQANFVQDAYAKCGSIPAAAGLANAFGAMEATIFGYASTTWNKVMQFHGFLPNGTSSGAVSNYAGGAFWQSTAAITRVTVLCETTANLVTGSQLRLYGRN